MSLTERARPASADRAAARRASPVVPTAPLSELQRGAGNGAVSALVQRLNAGQAPPAPTGMRSAMLDPRFAAVARRSRAMGGQQRQHPKPGAEVADAKRAAQPPANDALGQAKAAAVGDMTTAQPGVFDKAAFLAAVRVAIEKAVPENAAEAEEFSSSGKADAVKSQVKGQVASGRAASTADVRGKTAAPPDPGRAVVTAATAMAPPATTVAPRDPGGAAAMPTRAPAEQTDLSGPPRGVDEQMAEAKVTDEQLAKSNEPEFTGALAAKQEGEAHSAEAAVPVRAAEGQTLTATRGAAGGTVAGALAGISGARRTALTAALTKKQGAKSDDEAAKARISSTLEGIYATTKTETEGTLAALDGKVDTEFEAGEKQAKQAFEDTHVPAVRNWKIDRYLIQIGGSAQWVIDQFKPLHPDLIAIFARARATYLKVMDATINRVADVIGAELTRARARIAQGRDEMSRFIGQQQGEMAKFATEAGTAMGERFGDLEKSVDDKQEGMVDDLATKYVAARTEIDKQITDLQNANKGLWEQAKDLVGGAIDTILKLKAMLTGVLARAAGAIDKIVADPMAFLSNLVSGVRAGLAGFVANIGGHLKKGLQGWLFGELAKAGIELPATFDLKGIFTLITSILGLTWANFRARLVAKLGEPVVGKLEKGFAIVKAIATGGLAGAWTWIVEKIGDLKNTVMDQIKSFVTERVIMAGVQWLIGLLNPAAAFIKACKMIYDVIMWFVANGQRIKEFVDSILDSIESIVAGNIGKVAAMIESSLARILPLAIGFLASLIGLGGLGDKIKKILETVQKPVNKVFDFLIGKAVQFGKSILKRIKDSKLVKKVQAGLKKGKDWAKKKIAQAKAWAKKKIAGAKAWLKKKLGIKDKEVDPAEAEAMAEAKKSADAILSVPGRTPAEAKDAVGIVVSQFSLKTATLTHDTGTKFHFVLQRTSGSTGSHPLTVVVPAQRFLPPGFDVRRLYELGIPGKKGSSWGTRQKHLSAAAIHEFMPMIDMLPMLSRAEQRMAITELIGSQRLNPDALVALASGDLNSRWVAANTAYAVDHGVSAAEHWSNLGGNNMADEARNAHSSPAGNELTWITSWWNSKKGSLTSTGARPTYVGWVGPDFESTIVGSARGSFTISGQPFLDGPNGKPLP